MKFPSQTGQMELSFRTGDHIIVYGEMDEDGFYTGETADGRRGLVPSNFLRELTQTGTNQSSMSQSRAVLTRDQRTRGSQNSVSRVSRPYDKRTYKIAGTNSPILPLPTVSNLVWVTTAPVQNRAPRYFPSYLSISPGGP